MSMGKPHKITITGGIDPVIIGGNLPKYDSKTILGYGTGKYISPKKRKRNLGQDE